MKTDDKQTTKDNTLDAESDSVQRLVMHGRIQWKGDNEKPDPSRECLCKMKHGMLTAYYSTEENRFCGYFWRDIEFDAEKWCYLDEVEFYA